ncbi:FAD-dependent oxidoreductase [Hoyosella rhizosphaerae]|uniref:Amine oxidase n=1 Tax=Hoyosella rhizosphaerae TaxID=1755582 RepID=A0A916X8Q5_9ACTN|nr:FAD-dependent oxidoreductase [Hoyosella rhizosphaerae]MBN4927275.1 FAD-dependent oxidoreductase [Hoyosella rhizosphaerae]GGC52548.1 amine oxidase [Hoyosella rhizosphaerae]
MAEAKSPARRSVAVVGSGVAGLTAAWVLRKSADVTLYEADNRLGGHADTHDVVVGSRIVPIDTGFIVHNERTYPTLLKLFAELGVQTQETDMSMSVRCDGCGLEYAGGKKAPGLFPTAKVAVRRPYLRMLSEIKRFHKAARGVIDGGEATAIDDQITLGEFLQREQFSPYFTNHFMTPLVSAVWSCNPETAMLYPARYLFAFLDHHGMLSVTGSPTWRTVTGGSREYVSRVAKELHQVRVGYAVRDVQVRAEGIEIRDDSDDVHMFDAAVIATHPGQALRMLTRPTDAQFDVLSAMTYTPNTALLHTDTDVLPKAKLARASWNYRIPACDAKPNHVLVSYDMTRLQRLGALDGRRFMVTLGGEHLISGSSVIDRMEYEHPQYTPESIAAQRRLPEINSTNLAFAGAYHGWGFHEDGALSGLRAAQHLGGSW